MVVAALLVVGLIGWALTRTVEPATSVDATSEPLAVAPSSTAPAATTAETTTAQAPPSVAGEVNPFTPIPAETHSQDAEHAAVPRMAVEDLRAKLNRGDVVIVDVRDPASYARSHIPGALHIPLASIEANLAQLPKNKPIVTYCT